MKNLMLLFFPFGMVPFRAFFFASFVFFLLNSFRVKSEPIQDKQLLLAFISQVPHENRLSWNASDSACNWVGVSCDANKSFIYYLRLPAVGLVGEIPANTLGNLTQLRVLSLRSNKLTGTVPSDFSNLKLLRNIYLQNNQFSGEFPSGLADLTRLTRLDLSGNNFTGSIPFSLNKLTHLTGLFLQKNDFSGALPSINPPNLTSFDVSNNRLNGSIPTTLVKFPESSFAGNIDLCGGPLPPCNSFFSPTPSPNSPTQLNPPHKNSRKNLSTAAIIGISVASAALFLLLLLIVAICLLKKRKQRPSKTQKPVVVERAVGSESAAPVAGGPEAGTSSSKDDITGGSAGEERNKLVFFEIGGYSFDLEDLLRASAEVLGKGSVGTSYKAVLEEGTTVVVKRLKDVVVTKKEFEQQMELLGKMKHDNNVLPLRAYYYSKDEKLLVLDYLPAGSLSALLHGSRGSGRPPLDWESRMKIAMAAAKGLSYLHTSPNVVHGNIKSSNILLLQDNHDAKITDYGLNPVFSNSSPPNHRVGGYRAPEVLETRRVTFKSDVYSFGVLLLELLTGKAPNQNTLGEEGIDLPRWVQSVVREEWTAEVFDLELMRYQNVEEEMVQLLQIGMTCVATVPDQRPSMPEVVKLIEDINRDDPDQSQRHSSDDPSKGSESQTPPLESRASPPTGVAQ